MKATAAAVLLGFVLLGACRNGGGPTPGDVLPEAELTYPGARELRRAFHDEERARSIEGPDLSSPAKLNRRLALAEPIPLGTLLDWYQERLLAAGWRQRARSDNAVDFSKMVGVREHIYLVEGVEASAAGEPLKRYAVIYSIGYRDG